jgi:hypothetical protein
MGTATFSAAADVSFVNFSVRSFSFRRDSASTISGKVPTAKRRTFESPSSVLTRMGYRPARRPPLAVREGGVHPRLSLGTTSAWKKRPARSLLFLLRLAGNPPPALPSKLALAERHEVQVPSAPAAQLEPKPQAPSRSKTEIAADEREWTQMNQKL